MSDLEFPGLMINDAFPRGEGPVAGEWASALTDDDDIVSYLYLYLNLNDERGSESESESESE